MRITVHDLVFLVRLHSKWIILPLLIYANGIDFKKTIVLCHLLSFHWNMGIILQHDSILRCVISPVDVFQVGDQSGAQICSPRHVCCGGSVQQRWLQHYSLQNNCHSSACQRLHFVYMLCPESLSQCEQLQSPAWWTASNWNGRKCR